MAIHGQAPGRRSSFIRYSIEDLGTLNGAIFETKTLNPIGKIPLDDLKMLCYNHIFCVNQIPSLNFS